MAASASEPADAAPPPPAPQHPLPFQLLPTRDTDWDPASASVTLNVRLDGCIVPSEASPQGARIAYSHAVVIDDFIDEATRQELLQFLLWGEGGQPSPQQQQEGCQQQQQEEDDPGRQPCGAAAAGGLGGGGGSAPEQAQLPPARWERRTTDMAGAAPTWGVRQEVLGELMAGRLPALQEVGARLAKLYPECQVAHLPSEAIQLAAAGRAQHAQQQQAAAGVAASAPELDSQQQAGQLAERLAEPPPAKRSRLADGAPAAGRADGSGGDGHVVDDEAGAEEGHECGSNGGEGADGGAAPVDCACFVANAAVAGDSFRYHVDADPTSFPDGSPWHAAFGDYFNGEPGRPLLASLLLYLNDDWRRDWGADTLLLDGATDTGVFVAPKPRRAIIFDQDILHRVSAPLAAAGPRPRFSLVWKLVLLPRTAGQAVCVARPEWGPPTSFGSAARVDAVKRQLAGERRRGAAEAAAGGAGT